MKGGPKYCGLGVLILLKFHLCFVVTSCECIIPCLIEHALFSLLLQHEFLSEFLSLLFIGTGSEITYFKNGVCQGVAFRDIFAGEYFPAASMYTLPAPEKKCSVRFNFGPHLQFPPTEWGDRPTPRLMSQAPPPEGLGANIEEPPPVDDLKEPKKPDSTGGTASKLGSKQRMAAERGNGIAVAGLTVGSSTGGGARTKRATDPKDKGRRPGFPGKKGVLGKGPKKVVSLVPSLSLTNKNRNSIARVAVKVVAGVLSDDASGDLEADQEMEDPTQSSDEHSKWGS